MIKAAVQPREEIKPLGSYTLGKSIDDLQREFGLEKIIKLSENENPFGCSPMVQEAMIQEMGKTHVYPDGSAQRLAETLSKTINVKRNQLIFGNGSDEIIRLISRAFISKGDEAIMADVTFPRYKTNVAIEGGAPVIVPLINGVHDLNGMKEAITEKTKMIFVCNPNNPTGTVVGIDPLVNFIESVPSHILIVLDEAYYEYVTTKDYLESIPLLEKFPNVIILRTFSKLYGLAALRIGYGVAGEEIINDLYKVKDVFNANRLAQVAAIAAINDQKFVDECVRKNDMGRSFLEKEFDALGLTYFPSQANFIMVHFPFDGDIIADFLLKKGIIVRSGSLLGYPKSIRVTIGSMDENELFITYLKEALKVNN